MSDQQQSNRKIPTVIAHFTPDGVEYRTYYRDILTVTAPLAEIPKVKRPTPPPKDDHKDVPVNARIKAPSPENLRKFFNSDDDEDDF